MATKKALGKWKRGCVLKVPQADGSTVDFVPGDVLERGKGLAAAAFDAYIKSGDMVPYAPPKEADASGDAPD